MAILQAHIPCVKIKTFSSTFAPNSSFLSSSSFPLSSLKTHQEISLFSRTNTTKSTPFSPSTTHPRRLLCRPPNGKYVREDYLVKKKSAQEIQELVRGERNVPLIIDFYATWCGPCILMAQELEMLAVEYESNAMIVKVDTDDEYEFARDMQVRGLPTVFFISPDPNKDAIRTEGLIPIQMMRDIIDKEM
ncbi:thioredoxin-like protein CITRX, chloroplastic [Ricinus communis]|uniref:thioredoxin-like protein CITRX, chloroplastic n=1 Tax=Ricinus communis TaxID=3988 RepID=UPI0007728D6E|nr:thioredoxin-like protein CITRX, chloroplastic [Ricinus communis]|eukprot:XP_015570810.1 thioredoxin-like protein CITRX, chloroplastic [Ricinus communis]